MKPLDKIYVCSHVLPIPGSNQAIYWFGRIDQKDDIVPLKIVAIDYKRAWVALNIHYNCAVLDTVEDLKSKIESKS
jgi:hypothetical protein